MGITTDIIIGQGVKDFREKYKYIKMLLGIDLDVFVSGNKRCARAPRRRFGLCGSGLTGDQDLTGRRFQKRH